MYISVEDKKKIIDYLKEKFNPKLIYLFGSFAEGNGREDSDIDIAVYTDEVISAYDLFLASGDLGFLLRKDVQIVHLKDISTVFAAQVIGTRDVLYCSDKELMHEYNMKALKDYAILNEERKVILSRIKKDGRIYG